MLWSHPAAGNPLPAAAGNPSATVFQQKKPGDWGSVAADVCAELANREEGNPTLPRFADSGFPCSKLLKLKKEVK